MFRFLMLSVLVVLALPAVDYWMLDADEQASSRLNLKSRDYRFAVTTEGGDPVRWDPCQVVRLSMNRAHAPDGARRQLAHAVKVMREATGLSIRLVDDTTTPPAEYDPAAQVQGRWAPVLVAFVHPEKGLLHDTGSSAEATTVRAPDPAGAVRYVSGSILVNASQNHLYEGRAAGSQSRSRLFQHELAHILGLAHVGDRGSLMYPVILGRAGLSRGDTQGLRRLGPAGGSGCPERR